MTPSKLRIVSLLPSATEIVCGLGLRANLVGISHECDTPESIRSLPVVDMAEMELLQELKPDVIFTQDQHQVSAVSLKNKNTVICSLSPFSLDDVWKDFRKVGEVTGRQKEAEAMITHFWIRLNQVNAKTGTHLKYRPKVVALEWLDPPIVAGSWIPELITLAGADPLIVNGPKPFKRVSWAELYDQKPDKVVIFPCGWSKERTLEEMKLPLIKEKFEAWPGLTPSSVLVLDGKHYFNRPGPRIADSLEVLAAGLWPEKFSKKAFS